VVIAHIGGNCAGLHDPQDTSKCEDDLEGVALLKALPEGTVDAYLGGHVHRGRMRHFINGTAAAQSAPYSDEFSTIELAIDTQANRVIDERSSIRMPTQICEKVYSGTESCDPRTKPADAALVQRTFEGRAVGREPRIQAVVQPFLQQVEAKRNERLGITTAAEFKRGFAGESTLGNLLADALREWAGADIGIMNAGGIRSDLRAGELIYADIFNVAPFENYPAVLQMTGKEVFDALDVVTRGNRGLLQVSGIRYTVDDATRRVTSVTLPDGTPIDPARTYRVVMPDFLAFGGDGMAPVTNSIPRERIVIDQEAPLRDAIIEALRKRGGPLSPAIDGRISVLNRQPR
jgi:5'-nucleotidase